MKTNKVLFLFFAIITIALIVYLILYNTTGFYIRAIDPDDNGVWYVIPMFTALGWLYFYLAYKKAVAAYTCPNCGTPGALKSVSSNQIRTERIVETRDMYNGQQVKPYQVYGTRRYYRVTYRCPHCGYETNVQEYEDDWDV